MTVIVTLGSIAPPTFPPQLAAGLHVLSQVAPLLYRLIYFGNLVLALLFLVTHVLHVPFLKVTVAYFVLMTALITTMLYVSSATLVWADSTWHLWTYSLPVPVSVASAPRAAGPGVTVWLASAFAIGVHLTGALAIWRGAKLHEAADVAQLANAIKLLGSRVGQLQRAADFMSSLANKHQAVGTAFTIGHALLGALIVATKTVQTRLKAVTPGSYVVGEGLLAILVVGHALAARSPESPRDWLIVGLTAYLVVTLSGCDLTGAGPIAVISKRGSAGLSRGMHWLLATLAVIVAYAAAIGAGIATLLFVSVVVASTFGDWLSHKLPTPWWVILTVVVTYGIAGAAGSMVGFGILYGAVTLIRMPMIGVLSLIEIGVPEFYQLEPMLALPKTAAKSIAAVWGD